MAGFSKTASEMGVARKGLREVRSSAISLADNGVGLNGDIDVPISAISAAVKGVGRNSSKARPAWLGEDIDSLAVIEGARPGEEGNIGIGAFSDGDGNWYVVPGVL